METTPVSALNVWFADLPTAKCPNGSVIEFTFFWKEGQRIRAGKKTSRSS
jgi:hypothetical protein